MQECRGDKLTETAAQDLRHAELRVIGGVDEIMTIHDAERAAQAIAMHLGDEDTREDAHGFGDLDGEVGAVPVEQRTVRHLAQEVEIEPGGIDGAGALGDDDLERLVGANDFQRFEKSEAKRAVPAVAFVRPVEDDSCHPAIVKPLQNELGPFFEPSPDVGHAHPSARIAVLMARGAEEWLARLRHAIAGIFLGDIGLESLGRRDIGFAGGVVVLQSRQAATI